MYFTILGFPVTGFLFSMLTALGEKNIGFRCLVFSELTALGPFAPDGHEVTLHFAGL